MLAAIGFIASRLFATVFYQLVWTASMVAHAGDLLCCGEPEIFQTAKERLEDTYIVNGNTMGQLEDDIESPGRASERQSREDSWKAVPKHRNI